MRTQMTLPGSQLLQLLLSDELLPEGELPLVLRLLQALPGGVDVSDHLALAGRVRNLQISCTLSKTLPISVHKIILKLSQKFLAFDENILKRLDDVATAGQRI
jgi:hypothetical protein